MEHVQKACQVTPDQFTFGNWLPESLKNHKRIVLHGKTWSFGATSVKIKPSFFPKIMQDFLFEVYGAFI